MNVSKSLLAAVALAALAIPGIAQQVSPSPSPSPSPSFRSTAFKHHVHEKGRACGDIPIRYESTQLYKSFYKAYAVLDSPNFNTFKDSSFAAFGHTFTRHIPQRLLAAQLAIYGYDFVGTYRDYLLFYRRYEGSWQPGGGGLQLTAPNGEALPRIQLPYDLDPQWPAPSLVVGQAPFIGAIVLPQQIIAFPCEQ